MIYNCNAFCYKKEITILTFGGEILTPENIKLRYETLDHIWEISPYIFRFVDSANQLKLTDMYINKEIHFVYLVSGEMVYKLDDTEFVMKGGELVCINSFVAHSQQSLNDTKYARLIIDSNFLMRNGLDPSAVSYQERVCDPQVNKMFLEMIEEFKRNDFSHNILMNALILQFVGYMTRNYSRERTESESLANKKTMDASYKHIFMVIEYISRNFKNNITLDELSSVCGLNKYYFLRIFKKAVGISPANYVNKIRCDYAKQMILNGSNVTEAAFASGFCCASYFTECFKKYKGCLPSDLIKGMKS